MLYEPVGNDEDYILSHLESRSYSQNFKERVHTECSAENRELRENPHAFSHPDPPGMQGTEGVDGIGEARLYPGVLNEPFSP